MTLIPQVVMEMILMVMIKMIMEYKIEVKVDNKV